MQRPDISFEFFPPRNIEATFRLWDTVQSLAPLDPRFVSVTYGAGGTTRELTRDVVATLRGTRLLAPVVSAPDATALCGPLWHSQASWPRSQSSSASRTDCG